MIELIISLALLLTSVGYFIIPEKWGVLYYFVNTPPFIVLVPIAIFAAYALIFKRKVAKIALANVLIFLLFSTVAVRPHLFGPQLLSQDIKRDQPTQYTVCSWNTAYFFEFNRAEAFSYLSTQNCDIVLLQEVWRSDLVTVELEKYRLENFPDYALVADEEFVVMYPKSLKLIKKFRSEHKGYFAVELSLPGEKSIILVNTHIWNPIVPRPFYTETKTVTYLDGRAVRQLEQDELVNFVNNNNTVKQRMIVVMGDFNTTQNNEFFSRLTAPGTRLQNTAPLISVAEPLWALKSTYPASMPLLRLDYVFVSKPNGNKAELTKQCKPLFADHCLMILKVLL